MVTVRLQAADETDKNYYRRFAGSSATLDITYNFRPNTPTGLSITPTLVHPNDTCVGPSQSGWLGNVSSFTLHARISDPDGSKQTLHAQYQVWDRSTDPTTTVVGFTGAYQSANYKGSTTGVTAPSKPIPTSKLHNGQNYGYDARTLDNSGSSSNTGPASEHCYFWYDNANPRTPAVSSNDFNLDNSTKHVGQSGSFQLSATDPAPDNARASGIDHFDYTLTSPRNLNGDGGTHKVASSTGSTGTATINITPTVWGVNYLYVAAVDRAGNQSDTATYPFYVPDDQNAVVHPGDVDGDGHPDLLAGNSSNNDLYLLHTTTAINPTVISHPGDSPDGTSWANTVLAHRSSTLQSTSGARVDDLWAHKSGAAAAYLYTNNYNNAGHQVGDPLYTADNRIDVQRPACTSPTACDPSYAADWSTVNQMIAPGDGDGDGDGIPDLITVENGQLWFFHGTTITGKLSDPRLLGASGWDNWRIMAPGDSTGDGTPDLWTADSRGSTGTESIRLYPIDVSGDDISLGSYVTNINGANGGWGTDNRRLVASPGDSNGDGKPDIFSITNANPSQVWENRGTSLSPTNLSFSAHTVIDDGNGSHNWDNYAHLS